jgi:sodium-dependent dicarboxylate transporter 2/3/5
MAPAALAASCAFMLPVATPPNAIVYSSRYVSIMTMAKTGFWVNLFAIGFLTLFVMVWMPRMLLA